MLHPRAYLRQAVDSRRPTALMERESQPVQQVMLVGDEHGWRFKTLFQAPMPTAVIQGPGAFLMPIHLDSSLIPARTLERVQAIYAAGIRPKGFVIVHEAPKALAGKRLPTWQERSQEFWTTAKPVLRKSLRWLALGAGALLVVVGIALLVAVAATLLVGVAVVAAAGAAAGSDPVLVVVTEDNVWVEIDRWDVPA